MLDTSVHDSSSDDSSVRMYRRTQSFQHTRRAVDGSTLVVVQSADLSLSLSVDSSFAGPLMAPAERFSIERSSPCALQSQQLSGLFDVYSPLPGPS